MAPTTNATYQDMEGGQPLLVTTPTDAPKHSMLAKVLCAIAIAATVGIAFTAGAHSVGHGAMTNFSSSAAAADGHLLRYMDMQEDETAYGAENANANKKGDKKGNKKGRPLLKKAVNGEECNCEDKPQPDAYGKNSRGSSLRQNIKKGKKNKEENKEENEEDETLTPQSAACKAICVAEETDGSATEATQEKILEALETLTLTIAEGKGKV